jgi:tripartite-type tricarboxylate transporter receptor subunit TctC
MRTTLPTSLALFIAACAIVAAVPATGQQYPARPIRLIVASASGGAPDISARNLINELGPQLRQQIVVDNRPGAGGIIGYELLARAAPDGYTIAYIGSNIATLPSLYSKLPFDNAKDFQPVILYASNANLLAVTPSLPVRSLKELVELAKAKPGALSYGSPGVGGSAHLAMELLKTMTGANIVNVGYKGSQQAITDVIAGQIHMVCEVIAPVLPHVKSGRVRALGVTTLKRFALLPEVPTLDEAGIPGYEITNWGGYAFPARTPQAAVQRLNAEINKALLAPSVTKSIFERGSVAIGGTPEQFAEHIARETVKWSKVVVAAGVQPQ